MSKLTYLKTRLWVLTYQLMPVWFVLLISAKGESDFATCHFGADGWLLVDIWVALVAQVTCYHPFVPFLCCHMIQSHSLKFKSDCVHFVGPNWVFFVVFFVPFFLSFFLVDKFWQFVCKPSFPVGTIKGLNWTSGYFIWCHVKSLSFSMNFTSQIWCTNVLHNQWIELTI